RIAIERGFGRDRLVGRRRCHAPREIARETLVCATVYLATSRCDHARVPSPSWTARSQELVSKTIPRGSISAWSRVSDVCQRIAVFGSRDHSISFQGFPSGGIICRRIGIAVFATPRHKFVEASVWQGRAGRPGTGERPEHHGCPVGRSERVGGCEPEVIFGIWLQTAQLHGNRHA